MKLSAPDERLKLPTNLECHRLLNILQTHEGQTRDMLEGLTILLKVTQCLLELPGKKLRQETTECTQERSLFCKSNQAPNIWGWEIL